MLFIQLDSVIKKLSIKSNRFLAKRPLPIWFKCSCPFHKQRLLMFVWQITGTCNFFARSFIFLFNSSDFCFLCGLSWRTTSSDITMFVEGDIVFASFTISLIFFIVSSCFVMSFVPECTMTQSGVRPRTGLIWSEISRDDAPGCGLIWMTWFLFILFSSRPFSNESPIMTICFLSAFFQPLFGHPVPLKLPLELVLSSVAVLFLVSWEFSVQCSHCWGSSFEPFS